jgi:gluconate 2-dehydrogenase gamma chain
VGAPAARSLQAGEREPRGTGANPVRGEPAEGTAVDTRRPFPMLPLFRVMDPTRPNNRITRRYFLRASSAAFLAAPLLQPLPLLAGPWRFFNESEAATLSAMCERIIPADEDPGAAWAGVVYFIDRKLAGYYHRYQSLYRLGLQGVHQSSLAVFGKAFVELSGAQQDDLLRKLESNQAPGDLWKQTSAAEFFGRLVDHTLQGYYGGPRHGGNRDAASWRMLGLPTAPVRSRRPLTAPWNRNLDPPSSTQ